MGFGTTVSDFATQGTVRLEGSFMTNGTAQPIGNISLSVLPLASGNTFRGERFATVSRQSTGNYLVTLDPTTSSRYVIECGTELDDTALDGAYSTIGTFLNEGASIGTPLSFVLTTRAASGTLTDYGATTGTSPSRRCYFHLVIKSSQVGK